MIRQSGMTMIEILLSMAAFSLVMFGLLSIFNSTIDIQETVGLGHQRDQQIRVAMAVVTRDLRHAYISAHSEEGQDQTSLSAESRRTLFKGEDDSPVGELRFSSMSHQSFYANASESELTLVTYEALRDKESDRTNLIRRELRRLPDRQHRWKKVPQRVDVLLESVSGLEFRYFDLEADDWKKSWDSSSESQRNRLPQWVEVKLEVPNPYQENKTIEYVTRVKIPMTTRLEFR